MEAWILSEQEQPTGKDSLRNAYENLICTNAAGESHKRNEVDWRKSSTCKENGTYICKFTIPYICISSKYFFKTHNETLVPGHILTFSFLPLSPFFISLSLCFNLKYSVENFLCWLIVAAKLRRIYINVPFSDNLHQTRFDFSTIWKKCTTTALIQNC